ncbi:MAG: protein translocase subunit SecF [Christensenellaceae bacterium]|jgi:preprotein translocase subunit SecF|nr:protein translocase subunit SecF [Christensenellaceae bacterium]
MQNKKNTPDKSFNYEMRLLNSKYDFVKQSKWFWIAPCALIFVSLIIIAIFGLNLGLDFTGGTVISVKTGNADYNQSLTKITEVLNDNNLRVASAQLEGSGADAKIAIKYQDIDGTDMDNLTQKVRREINEKFATGSTVLGDSKDITTATERISATARGDLIFNAFVTVIFAIALMLLYIVIRFEAMSGLATILGLVHDVILTIAFLSIFRIPVNSTVVAAVITIIGYSINNSIIVFDRIRENLKKPALTYNTNHEIANLSIKQTLVRSVNTTVTTIVAVLMLAIIGVPSVREFVLIIVVGLVAGVYSSIFLVPEFWALVNHKRKLVKPEIAKEVAELEAANNRDSGAPVVEVSD